MNSGKGKNILEGEFAGINYWFRADDEGPITVEHIDPLEEHAQERIGEMMSQGYVCGQLIITLYDEFEEEVGYSGWWGGK